ncbi:MAG: UDP-N-acetylmuramoyl-tripeptide--D-alanyl-D-alanine ligase [Actinomycetota bacterium]|jgi:UDP-N-acetylmuramoyl-tripeptide--D-alanyl-D-alanine ligase|nr:UDP-N-acetylmuramoyl-tripeptide--D-alanyl-D-alanine ligase [Actinomycetota bacterium]MCL6092480.1 UDP-N-acetylmuramoyl-tripeptide--D-alanyl-D-alanine ligase [Actinomycetota bacterium]MDA8167995.1 UDP-N-acetylmuramoyl-tripeptide--D-alanyl-D-alanine ligase [Actinomycetota bacterium]
MAVSTLKQIEEVITLTAQEICDACSGELLAGNGATPVIRVCTDTREDLTGSFFVGLRGERFDGGVFAADALGSGAAGVVVESEAALALAAGLAAGGDPAQAASADGGFRDQVVISVADSGQALKQIATLVAGRSDAPVVAITGSTGKTSTKDILFSLLGSQLSAVASKASFNNEVGVPLTLLSIARDTQVAVVEMGMQAPGEIAELCAVAAPQIAIITNIGPAHLEFAGSLDNIARGKAEIAAALPAGGALVLPYGEELLEPHLRGLAARRVTFGFDQAADIHTINHGHLEDGRLCCTLSCLGEEIDICFNFAARHHLLNAMAAIGAYGLLGLPLEAVPAAAWELHLPSMRGEALPLPGGGTLLNDCYNANPLSMRSSLDYLIAAAGGGRTVAVLGDMGELGPESDRYHRQVGAAAAELGVDCIVGVGRQAAGYVEGASEAGSGCELFHYGDREAAIDGRHEFVRPGDIILVKASRFMRLEELSAALTGSGSDGGNADNGFQGWGSGPVGETR